MSASDSSDDEENNKLLQEAVDTQFIHDGMFKRTNEDRLKERQEQKQEEAPKSLRPTTNTDDQFNSLNVTPEVQKYVAKQLSSLLDKKLDKMLSTTIANCPPAKHKRGGVRLLSDSPKYIKVESVNGNPGSTANLVKPPPRLIPRNREDCDLPVNFSAISVNPIDILNKKDIKNWSTKSKGKIFTYKKDKTGTLTLVE